MNNQPANTIGKKEIEELLTQGCDERVHILPESGLNKYHLNLFNLDILFVIKALGIVAQYLKIITIKYLKDY